MPLSKIGLGLMMSLLLRSKHASSTFYYTSFLNHMILRLKFSLILNLQHFIWGNGAPKELHRKYTSEIYLLCICLTFHCIFSCPIPHFYHFSPKSAVFLFSHIVEYEVRHYQFTHTCTFHLFRYSYGRRCFSLRYWIRHQGHSRN
jgi:hypothetical protein